MLRIAQLAPPFVPVPPTKYGGTERVVSLLTEELVRRGHTVTLFASGDSSTSAELVPTVPDALWERDMTNPAAALALAVGTSYGRAREFDVIHSHVDFAAYPAARLSPTPSLHTLHGRLNLPSLRALYASYSDMALVSISDSQRRPLPRASWLTTVYNGVDVDELRYNAQGGRYLVFLARISPEKGLARAIRIARRAGAELMIAAREPLSNDADPVVRADWEYYEHEVKPLLREPGINYVGELDGPAKAELLGGALALLNPIDWEEPFGLNMAESLACGTPVLATRRGSVPEVVEHGVTGWIGDDEAALAAAVERVERLERARCRRAAEERFSTARMADGYLAAYARLLGGRMERASVSVGARNGQTEYEPSSAALARWER
jgi:glycosyltransferase involved in cell wall biosynthesis